MSSITDFTNTRRELKHSLYDALDYAKNLEEQYQAMSQLVETLTHANYKKDRKIRKLTKKLEKCKSDAKYRGKTQEEVDEEEWKNERRRVIERDGWNSDYYTNYDEDEESRPQKEVIDLTQIPEEEDPPMIPQPPKIKIEKTAKKVKIEEPVVIVIEEEEVVEEVVEIEEEVVEEDVEKEVEEIEEEVVEEYEEIEEEVVEEVVEETVEEEVAEETPETEIEEQEEEENIEPELEPDVISEPEENQPTEEPILEKEEEEMELIIEDPEEEQEEVVEETAEEEEEEELYEVVIGKTSYYVANEVNGPIYEITADQEVGEEVGNYVNGKPVFQSTAPEPKETEEVEEEEEEIELIQIKINKVNYAIENEIDGPIYSLGFDGDVDEEVGKYVNGKPTFYPTKAKTATK